MFLVSVLALCILTPAACVFLAGVHAGVGWYEGVGILLAGLGTWRTMAPPSAGIRIRDVRPKPHSSISRPNPPIA